MATYTIHTWNATDRQGINRHTIVAERRTARAAKRYAKQHAYDYHDGLYIRRPNGIVDTGLELIAPDGSLIGETK